MICYFLIGGIGVLVSTGRSAVPREGSAQVGERKSGILRLGGGRAAP